MKARFVALIALGGSLAVATSGTASTDPHGPLDKMPHDLEVRFALSALPPGLRSDATVYVLDPATGYVLDHTGTNGQSCFVSRTEWKFADYRNDVFDATCYDAIGAANHMQVLFDAAAMRAQRVPPEIMKKQIEAGFTSGKYRAPTKSGFSYMTAPVMRTYMSLDPNDKSTVMTMPMPHVMYYAPNVRSAEVGGLSCPPCAPYPFLFEEGPHGYVIQRLGARETEKILTEEADLVRDLCGYRRELCLAPPLAK